MFEYLMFILGLALLIKGASWLVDGSSSLAKNIGVPTFIIGLTIVTLGTTLPEFFVSIIATLNGEGEIVLGNIIGSNLTNILLVFGLAAVITKIRIKVHASTTLKEVPFALLATIVLFIITNKTLINGDESFYIHRADGILMILFLAIFIYYVVELARENEEVFKSKFRGGKIKVRSYTERYTQYLVILAGVVSLYLGSRWVVSSVGQIATDFGVSTFVISATTLAIGTSLPELFTAITAALKNNVDIAVGNVVGANIFNVFWALGVSAVIAPLRVPSFILLDIIFLVFVTFLLFLFLFFGRRDEFEKWQGISFVFIYVIYVLFLFLRG